MYHRPNLVEEAYRLAWQQSAMGMRSVEELAAAIIVKGIPPDLAMHVARQISPERYPRQSRQQQDLFQFGLFLLSIGFLVACTTMVLSSTPFVLPMVFISGIAIVWGRAFGRPRHPLAAPRRR